MIDWLRFGNLSHRLEQRLHKVTFPNQEEDYVIQKM